MLKFKSPSDPKFPWDLHAVHNVYFHGEAEQFIEELQDKHNWPGEASDLVCLDGDPNALSEGHFDADVYGQPAEVYLWKPEGSSTVRGLVCLRHDLVANECAMERLVEERSHC